MRHMNAELVCAPRSRPEFGERKGERVVRKIRKRPIFGYRAFHHFLLAAAGCSPRRAAFQADGDVNHPTFREFSPEEGAIRLFHPACLEKSLKVVKEILAPGNNEDSRRFPVKTMDDARAKNRVISYFPDFRIALKNPVYKRFFAPRRVYWVGKGSCGLPDCQESSFLVYKGGACVFCHFMLVYHRPQVGGVFIGKGYTTMMLHTIDETGDSRRKRYLACLKARLTSARLAGRRATFAVFLLPSLFGIGSHSTSLTPLKEMIASVVSPVRDYVSFTVRVTAYSSAEDETDDTPFITASGSTVEEGIIAANFLPFGTRVMIPKLFGDRVFVVKDRMHRRKENFVDIWMPSKEEAREFGIHRTEIYIVGDGIISLPSLALLRID